MTKRLLGLVLVLGVVAAALWLLRPQDRIAGEAPPPLRPAASDVVERGRELVTLANCKGCHTVRGGAPYAGRRVIPTPFGRFYSPNITPDLETGIGRWSADDFWHALHNGRAPDGALLYPTFPYTNYTKISRADADAMFAYLRTIAPAQQANVGHELRFPYDQRWLLFAWRALFFRPGVYAVDGTQSAEWNRGAYLTQGVAHCSACHEARNALGAIRSEDNPSGGLVLNWYAPSLTSTREAGVQHWSEEQTMAFLETGVTHTVAPSSRAAALGPMAEVVFGSLQHAREDDLHAMTVYLKSLPDSAGPPANSASRLAAASRPAVFEEGREIYARDCARCHGDNGEGRMPAAPALAGNRAVTMRSAVNPIRAVLYGGFPPGTQANPRPFGMPPFYQSLRNDEVASVVSYVRASWGNSARPVGSSEVQRNRTGPLW